MFSRNHSGKIFASLFILCSLLLSSCAQEAPHQAEPPTLSSPEATHMAGTSQTPGNTPLPYTPEPSPTPELPEGIPNIIGIYIEQDGDRVLVEGTHKVEWTSGEDIECYEAIVSNAKLLSGSGFASIWTAEWERFRNTENVKIGYAVDILLKSGEKLSYDIKSPEDAQIDSSYIEFYLYDDVHQDGWYSHLEPDDINSETVTTSMKFTAGSAIGEVDKMHLKAYIYTTDFPDRICAEYEIDILRA